MFLLNMSVLYCQKVFIYPYYHFDRFFIGQIIKCLKLFVRRILIKSFLWSTPSKLTKTCYVGVPPMCEWKNQSFSSLWYRCPKNLSMTSENFCNCRFIGKEILLAKIFEQGTWLIFKICRHNLCVGGGVTEVPAAIYNSEIILFLQWLLLHINKIDFRIAQH